MVNSGDPAVIDDNQCFSNTKLWEVQRAFYENSGVKCWQECVVPNFVTCNCFVASAYARCILAFLQDHFSSSSASNSEEPVYIVEIGAGSAKLSYVLLHKLVALRKFWPKPSGRKGKPCFKYIVTDYTTTSLPFWTNHPQLSPFIEEGLIDFARFDVEEDSTVTLAMSGKVLTPGSLDHPIVGVANYVFDSLRADAFRIVDGQLEELLCTSYSPHMRVPSPQHGTGGASTQNSNSTSTAGFTLTPELLRSVKLTWAARPVNDPKRYYPLEGEDKDTGAGRALLGLVEKITGDSKSAGAASFLLPVGAFKAIHNMRALSKDNSLVMLIGDKGHTDVSELSGLRDPHIAQHGSFSCMVNFVALEQFAESEGGFTTVSPYLDGFKVMCMGLGIENTKTNKNHVPQRFRMQCGLLLGSSCTFGPDAFSSLQRCLKEEGKDVSLRTALAVVRLSQFDPDVFYKFKQVFIDKGPQASEKLQNGIRHDMEQVYKCYYPLQPSKDVAFEIGRIFMGLKDFAVAADHFKASQRHCGVHHVSWYNMGVCYYYLNRLTLAAQCFDSSLQLCAEYPDAVKWRAKVAHLTEFLGDTDANDGNVSPASVPPAAAGTSSNVSPTQSAQNVSPPNN